MRITFQDLREETQLDVWDEVRIFLVCAGYIPPRAEDEASADYEHRVYQAVDDYINRQNQSIDYDLCPTSN